MPSPYVDYAEYHENQGNGYNLLDHLWYGSRATIASAAHSVYNSVLWYGNKLGFDTEPVDTAEALRNYDDDLAAYYNEHKVAVDTLGFIGTSIIPGGLAIKAVKGFQTGKYGAAGSRITGMLSSKRQDVLNAALDEMKTASTGIAGQLKAAKNRIGVMGLKDNFVQSFAAETAIFATMHEAPIFEDMDMKDLAWNFVLGVGLGTGIGGAIDYFSHSSLLKSALKQREKAIRPFEQGGELGAGAYTPGDRIVALINHIDELPSVSLASAYAPAQLAIREQTVKQTLQKAQALANEMAGGDAALGKSLLDMEIAARTKGASVEDLYNMFGNAIAISRAGREAAISDDVFYVRRDVSSKPVTGFGDIISAGPIEGQLADVAYKLRDKNVKPSITYIGVNDVASVAQGYAKGFDIVIDAKHRVHINPKAQTIVRAARPGEDSILKVTQEVKRKATGEVPQSLTGSVYMDLANGAYADNVYAGASDIYDLSKAALVNKGEELVVNGEVISSFSKNVFEEQLLTVDYVSLNARWALAERRGFKVGDEITEWDLPFLVKAKNSSQATLDELGVVFTGNNLEESIELALRNITDEMLDVGKNMDEISLALNLPREVVDKLDFSWSTVSKYYTNPEWMKFTTQPRFAKLTYRIGTTQLPTAGMTVRGMAQVMERIKLVEETNRTATAAFFGQTFNELPDLRLDHVRGTASAAEGAGAGAVSFAEGNYGSVASSVQFIGSIVHKYITDYLNSVVEKLTFAGSAKLIENQAIATEFGLLAHAVQSTGEKYRLVRDINGKIIGIGIADAAAIMQGAQDALAARTTLAKAIADGKLVLPNLFTAAEKAAKGYKQAFIAISDPTVASLLEAHHSITSKFASQTNRFYATQGLRHSLNPDDIYFAPVDTSRFQYVAFIRDKQGSFGKTSTVGAIFGRDLTEFQKNLGRIDTNKYDIIKKSDSKLYHEALGDYEYSLMMNENATDQFIKREGMLAEFYPTLNGKELIERQLDYYRKQISRLTRNYVELHYARQFEELRTLGDVYTAEASSLSRKVAKGYETTIDDPFRSYIKTALDMSRLSEHRLWAETNEKADAFLSSAWRTAKEAFGLASEGKISFEAANDAAEKAGLGRVYENMANELWEAKQQFASYQGSNFGRQMLTKFVSTANSVLATLSLRLDAANSLINVISTPVLLGPELRSILKHLDNPEMVGELSKILTYAVPGGNNKLPTATRLIHNAVKNFFDRSASPILRQRYKELGFIRNNLDLYHDMLDDIAITGYEAPKALEKIMQAIVEKATKLTGSDLAEEFTRFVSANVMDQLTTIAKLDARTANAYINTFVNRVNGIYLASQRPVIFQGPIGQAIGLFQTYQFNLMQNVFRHSRNKDNWSVAALMGLQGSIFGLQGLPGFHIINTHLIGNAAGNHEHNDAFSTLPDFLLYGSASWLSDSSLYTRGDITPRNMTVVPINPMSTPIANATAKVINNSFDFVRNLAGGAGLIESFAYAVEHNGVNRPLAGIAVALKGESTTNQGNLIAKNIDFLSWSTALRIIGAKPMDEAVAMDANYRMLAYRAHDKELRSELGKVIKIKLLAGDDISQEELEDAAIKYAKYGGTQEGFNRWMNNLVKNTDEAVANQLFNKVNSPLGRRMQEVMGGEELPDYSNAPEVDQVE